VAAATCTGGVGFASVSALTRGIGCSTLMRRRDQLMFAADRQQASTGGANQEPH
jgi:hypothetical protein